MSITVKKIALSAQPSPMKVETKPKEQITNSHYLGLVEAIEVQCNIRIGTISLSIAELRQLKIGQALQLQQKTNEPIEIVLNDQVIAKGELMSYEDNFALQITEVTH
ncbi:MAG: FliM/FliN family flagellar motor switch protein [Legionellales bacterium]